LRRQDDGGQRRLPHEEGGVGYEPHAPHRDHPQDVHGEAVFPDDPSRFAQADHHGHGDAPRPAPPVIESPIMPSPLVGIVMGSDSDWETLSAAESVLSDFGVPCEVEVVSAHRTPERMFEYAKTAYDRGIKVIIAGAGGAAHLPGMISSLTILPVLGVPVLSR